jgi:hypothetical protein
MFGAIRHAPIASGVASLTARKPRLTPTQFSLNDDHLSLDFLRVPNELGAFRRQADAPRRAFE